MKLLIILLLIIIPLNTKARETTNESIISVENMDSQKLTDNNENTFITIKKGTKINFTSNTNIYGIYIRYELKSAQGKLNSNEISKNIGENNFLHEYIDLKDYPNTQYNLIYDDDVSIGEINIIGAGDIPDFIEIWEPPLKEADLLLLSTHADDEQLFFLGLLPTYVAKGANVQVAYFTNHNDNPKRLHEQLHGLYVVGIRNYPIIGPIPDAFSKNLDDAIKNINKHNISLDDAINYQIELIRRFKPQVIVGHDENGEYSHGQHILNTHTLKLALEKSNDPTFHPESAEKYGTWNVPKTYLHLYHKNQITMDYDTKLDYFNGLTAYEVSKKGYKEHHSQEWTWFTKWINGKNNEYTKATDIKTYSPIKFGLYRSLVGADVGKNDMFENLTFRKDQIPPIKETEKITEEKPIKEIQNENEEIKKEKKPTKNNKDLNIFLIIIATIVSTAVIICLINQKKSK